MPQRLDEALGDAARHLEIGRPDQQDRELVAAEASDGIGGAQRPLQARPDFGQQLIANLMAERVVDVLEAVEIEQQHRHVVTACAARS